MDFVGSFVNLIDSNLIAPFVQQIKHFTRSSDNVNEMGLVVGDLKATKNDKEHRLNAAKNAGQVETEVASNWFKAVREIEMKADDIEKEYHQRKCAGGWCVNCWSLYRLSKRSVNLKQQADRYKLNENFDVARPASPKSVKEIPTEPIMENQPSTERMLKQMLDCICDPDPRLGIIGLYGMGGVGKSTLAGKVNNHFKDSSCFEAVIMVTVSATPNIQTIHTSIGKRLGLDLSKDSEDDAREKLFDALGKRKFLLILDDVWSKLELKVAGIPHPRNSKGSKILVISRNQDTCSVMGAKETIRVQPLSEAESWNLFVDKAGEHVASGDIKRFARKIVERCKGLPLAVVIVAQAMVNRHGVGSWEDALREMERSAAELQGMKEEVFVPLKFSFDRLENDMLRSLFLYCACFPEDYNIDIAGDDMLNYCVGEGLLDKLGSLKAARNKGEYLIESLKIGCMLEDGEYEGSVKMHDMMRELAIWITSSSSLESGSSPKFLIKTGKSFKEAPQSHEWVDATRISLIDTQIEELPELGERCPKLTTYLFRQNDILTIFPQTNFLEHMDHLSVLDLSY
ncbi:disease resistance protein RPS5-like [Macadamia integrifolia]|uniref:disease resistance protein RPS5-like n=1 Tax=Macadamia integrifolia TaxID=60698 RepID=UPI001C501CD5|nr:disease resistance protein RPS5-like [Macadamia integrifolia]